MYENNYMQPNGYMGQYLNRLQAAQQPQLNRYEVVRVNGRNGAEAFQMAPNSSIILMDETMPVVWLKRTDGAGYPTIVAYEITPYKEPQAPDFGSLEARLKRLEDMLNEKSNVGYTEQSTAGTGTDVGTK